MISHWFNYRVTKMVTVLDLIIIPGLFVFLEGNFPSITIALPRTGFLIHVFKNWLLANKRSVLYHRLGIYRTGFGWHIEKDWSLRICQSNSDLGTDYLATFSDVVKRANVKLTPFSQCKDAYRIEFRLYRGFLIRFKLKNTFIIRKHQKVKRTVNRKILLLEAWN